MNMVSEILIDFFKRLLNIFMNVLLIVTLLDVRIRCSTMDGTDYSLISRTRL